MQKNRPELVAQEEIDEAQGKDLEANAGVSSAKDAVAGSEQALLGAKAQLEKDKDMFAYARISSPFTGVVTKMYAYTGALLPAGTSSSKGDQALCRVSENDLLRLVIPVPERAVAGIRLGEPIAVTVSALNKTFTGKVVRYSDQIDMDTRTMHTELQVPNPNYEIVPGMYADVKLPLRDQAARVDAADSGSPAQRNRRGHRPHRQQLKPDRTAQRQAGNSNVYGFRDSFRRPGK